MFRESIIVRQLFFGFLFSFLAVGGLQAKSLEGMDGVSQRLELVAESESTFYSSAEADQVLELEVAGAGILLLESESPEGEGPTLIGALQSRGGVHWIRQQGTYLSLAFTGAGVHQLRIVQGGLPEALEGVFVPTPTRSRQLQLPTARGPLDVEQIELLDPMDGSVWVGLLEMRDPLGLAGSVPANVDLSWTSQRQRRDASGSVDTAMVVTARQVHGNSAWGSSQNDDPHPPDDEVNPWPSGGSPSYLSTKSGQSDDPHPPDDEVNPWPSGGSPIYLSTKSGQNDDPHPPDDEVNPWPSGGSPNYLVTKSGQNDDPHPPDDEVNPWPSGGSPSYLGHTNGILVHQLGIQLRSTYTTDADGEALAVMAWLSQVLMPELGVQSPVDVEVRGLIH